VIVNLLQKTAEKKGREEKARPTSQLRPRMFRFLTLHLLSLADLGRETSLDGSDTATRAAVVAGDEVQTVLALVKLGIG
jgi:hypothetical protein